MGIISPRTSCYQPGWASGQGDSTSDVAAATSQVITSLAGLDLVNLGISPYNQRYLKEKFAKPEFEACVATYMLSYLLDRTAKDKVSVTLIDF
ncbi:MAG: hypothetical protein AAF497_23545, partial [Planctomycetota bacterium]